MRPTRTSKTKTDGQAFLDYISGASSNRFEQRFTEISARLNLGAALDARELSLLYEAAFLAALCNISFNGLGGCGGRIHPKRELVRTMLEREFMRVRERFFHCPGVDSLSTSQMESLKHIFFKILIEEENLN